MTEILININPFTGEVLVQRDGKNIPKTAKLAEYYKSFFKASENLPDDLENDYNETEANIVTETSPFESLFLSVLFDNNKNMQVIKREFAINIPLKERITNLCALLEKYHKNSDMLSAMRKNITVFSDTEYGEKIKETVEKEYPQLENLGLAIQISDRPALCNILKDTSKIRDMKKNIAAVDGELYPVIFVISDSNKIIYDDQLIIWNITEDSLLPVLTAFLDRYFLAPAISRVKKTFKVAEDVTEDLCNYTTLDQVRETVVVSIPDEVEAGKSYEIKTRSFSRGEAAEIRMESAYREILDVEKKDSSTFILKAISVGDSDLKVFKKGELTPILQKCIRVVNYGYATSVKILIDGKDAPNHILTPGTSVPLSLRYEPADSLKTSEDAQNAQWIVSDEKVGVFDKEKMLFTAKAPGIAKVTVKLHRVQHEVVMVVKQSVSDFAIELLNKEHPHIEDVRMSGEEHQGVEYIHCLIATKLDFKLNRFPEKSKKTAIVLKASEGLSVKKEADEEHFSVSAIRIGHSESLTISLQGTELVKKIIFDVSQNNGSAAKDNTLATYIGGSLVGTVVLWFLAMWCEGFNIVILFIGGAFIGLDSIILFNKVNAIPKLSDQEKKKYKILFAVMLILTIAAFVFSIFKPQFTYRLPKRKQNYSLPSGSGTGNQKVQLPRPQPRPVRPLNPKSLPGKQSNSNVPAASSVQKPQRTLHIPAPGKKEQIPVQNNNTENSSQGIRSLNVINNTPAPDNGQSGTYRTLKPVRTVTIPD